MSKTKEQILNWYQEVGGDELIGHTKQSLIEQSSATSDKILSNIKTDKKALKPLNSGVLNNQNEQSSSRVIADNCNDIHTLFEQIKNFEGCELKLTATNTVVGQGITDSEILMIGEAPGAQEDLEGRPFCGDSGKLLNMMLERIGLSRDKNFFITNTVFWRPPGNRRPTNEELELCRPFLEKIIALMKPKLIIMVGSVSTFNLTGLNLNMNQLRSQTIEYTNSYLEQKIKCFTIFHPAFLLRQPSQKKSTWFDLLKIKQYILNNHIKL
ncbi:uracil-DNA glycosylase [Rickettsiales endosymbiont of Stachyamoeba lipophora]|uniref:uracil-DNA glycosylase n=1 Tax=Rickettsiales endosymbiont of Stachyamoeba lipophora TaxID=2486578 RepID=UPI000F6548D7|nr:uracil-DNA glycosylase [Rickettsiales endosymbiont of Stachyamoeba lipophora]AZL15041.1 uracil-DNA glycosylase [Rickettsiales endosymbiont of Stachyamoeba lipophora]